jgi:hypothetical protein
MEDKEYEDDEDDYDGEVDGDTKQDDDVDIKKMVSSIIITQCSTDDPVNCKMTRMFVHSLLGAHDMDIVRSKMDGPW